LYASEKNYAVWLKQAILITYLCDYYYLCVLELCVSNESSMLGVGTRSVTCDHCTQYTLYCAACVWYSKYIQLATYKMGLHLHGGISHLHTAEFWCVEIGGHGPPVLVVIFATPNFCGNTDSHNTHK